MIKIKSFPVFGQSGSGYPEITNKGHGRLWTVSGNLWTPRGVNYMVANPRSVVTPVAYLLAQILNT